MYMYIYILKQGVPKDLIHTSERYRGDPIEQLSNFFSLFF